jgi:ribosomal-protein-alanine N-acetyltransferase
MHLTWIELEGHGIRLEPLRPQHADALSQAADPDTFRYFVSMQPRSLEPLDFRTFVHESMSAANTMSYALIVEGQPAGMSSFMDIRQEHRGLEIGMTWIAKRWQGTHVNPAMKLLMLDHAFACGALRVQLKMDSRNKHSERAVAKLGAVREGVLRKHFVLPDGYVRDTVMFSITDDEWPSVREGLLRRLGH